MGQTVSRLFPCVIRDVGGEEGAQPDAFRILSWFEWPQEAKFRLIFVEGEGVEYVFVDSAGNPHLIMPLCAGDEIGVDNTCKAAMELQRFFGCAHNSESQRSSALHNLQRYADRLEFHKAVLEKASAQGRDSEGLLQKKTSRLQAVREYIQDLERTRPHVACLKRCFPEFPEFVAQALQDPGAGRPTNLLSMRLSPAMPDHYTLLPHPTFALCRRHQGAAPFRDALAELLQGGLPNAQWQNPLARHVFASLSETAAPGEQGLAQLQELTRQFFAPQVLPPFEHSLDSLAAIAGGAPESGRELFELFVQAESVELPAGGPLQQEASLEKVSILVQMLLALVSLHIRAYSSAPLALGAALDGAEAPQHAQAVYERLFREDPETAVVEWVIEHFELDLGRPSLVFASMVKQRLDAFWRTVQDAPHYDEFLTLFKDLGGRGVHFQAKICMHYAEFWPSDQRPPALQHLLEAFEAPKAASRGQSLPHKFWSSSELLVPESEIMTQIKTGPVNYVAQLLLTKYRNEQTQAEHMLYEHVLDPTKPFGLRDDWPMLRNAIAAHLPDQAALDAFTRCTGDVSILLRITTHMARSLYTKVAFRGNSGSIDTLYNHDRPAKIHRALQDLDVDIPIESIEFCDFDGYTASMSLDQAGKVQQVHEEQKNNFYFPPEMARLIYLEVSRRYAEDSPEYVEMQTMHNGYLVQREDPRPAPPGVQGPRPPLEVPPKMFRACQLLDIIVPQWTFNGSHGYIVTADDATLESLTHLMETSRQQAVLENRDTIPAPAPPPVAPQTALGSAMAAVGMGAPTRRRRGM